MDSKRRNKKDDNDQSESSDVSPEMQAILDRRRKMADSSSSNNDKSSSSHNTDASHPNSPVKSELKTVPMGSEMQAIMAKRREKADGNLGDHMKKSSSRRSKTSKRSVGSDDRSVDSTDSSIDPSGRKGTRRKGGRRHHGGGGGGSSRREHADSSSPRKQQSSDEDEKQRRRSSRKPSGSSRSVTSSEEGSAGRRNSQRSLSDDRSVRSRDSARSSKEEKQRRSGGGSHRKKLDGTSDHSGSRHVPKKKPVVVAAAAAARAEEEPEESLHLEDDMAAPTAAAGGWGGDFPTFGGGGAPPPPAASADAAFGNFDFGAPAPSDAGGFGAAFDDVPITTSGGRAAGGGGGDKGKSLTKSDFDDAFSPAAFESGNAFAAFGSQSIANFDVDFAAEKGFGGGTNTLPVLEETPPEKVWDKTPLTNLPRLPPPTTFPLGQETVLQTEFEGRPTNNPVNGNVLTGTLSNGQFVLREIDPRRGGVQVTSVPILTPEFQHKVATKYNATCHKVESILSLTAGLHYSNGQKRTRVAAILDLAVLESRQILRLVTVWQWGYATGSASSISLQYTLTPPSGGDFFFDSSTLQIADGLLFLAGASPKGPCVFMCKPAVKETWSANFLGGAGRVACMAVTPVPRTTPYLAIALNDGTVNVWTYRSALQPTKEASKRWLFPLCRLEAQTPLTSVEASSLSENIAEATGRDSKDPGRCTHLEWLPPQPAFSSPLMLGAAFQNGLIVFHVGLPVVEDANSKLGYRPLPEPTQGTNLSQAPILHPLVAKRWQGKHDYSCLSWLNYGPQNGPCLALLLHSNSSVGGGARLVLGTMNFPLHRKDVPATQKERLVAFRIFSSLVLDESSPVPTGLLRGSGIRHVYSFSDKHILRTRFGKEVENIAASLSHPVASLPHGLSSTGEPLAADDDDDKDSILHVYSVLHCERKKVGPTLLDWSRPTQRHWLCRSVVGDTKQTACPTGSGDQVASGADSNVVCELFDDRLVARVPYRIQRSGQLCAISYRRGLCSSKNHTPMDVSLDAPLTTLVDHSGSEAVLEVLTARDVTFLPGGARGVSLSVDGSTLTYFEWKDQKCEFGSAFRPIVGVEPDSEDFVDCRRVFAFRGAGKVVLAAVGTRHRDRRSCVVIGEMAEIESITAENWSDLLPNLETDRSCWLEEGEEILSIIGLEGDDSGYRNFAASTSSRVVILSSALTISAEVRPPEICSSLAPLGSFGVSYICRNKLHYLSCLDDELASGIICSFPLRKHGYSQHQLMSVRQDRCLVLEWHSGSRLVEVGQNPNTFLLPTATTLPALLLEPLIANAVCVGGKESQSTPVLRAVIERFGRKVASITHGDNEGIGQHGAGLTPRVFEILGRYGLKHASTWLLTGTVQFERSANSKIIPSWLPVTFKAKGGLNTDTTLHLVSNGDQYFNDYVKSPDQNMSSPLPRESDPTAYLCREYAQMALQKGKGSDALKLLDLVGSEGSESALVQLALMLEKGGSHDASGLLKLISGYTDNAFSKSGAAPIKVPSSLAALSVCLKTNKNRENPMTDEEIQRWIKPLAPSLQRTARAGRIRQKLIGEKDLAAAAGDEKAEPDPLWVSQCSEAKHVWNEGPKRDKENLLMLDRLEDWMGRRRPLIIGKEGAAAASDRGEKTLADILNQDDDSFGGMSDQESEKDDWVEGVGEGRSDEANLSGYFRMSEGEDEDSPWSSEGLQDLSPYHNKAIIVGDAGNFSLQESTSSVDEGEPGKVKSLFDLVFEKSGAGIASGLALSATRGGSIDVGLLHGPDRQSRKRCSIEFWYYLPAAKTMAEEIVLARRTFGETADDFAKVCLSSDKESMLWEIGIRKTGELQFRSCGGSSMLSSQNHDPAEDKKDEGDSSDDEKERPDLVVFERWNHVCIVLSSKGLGVSECSVSLYMKGKEVASMEMNMLPPGYEAGDLDNTETLNEIMQKSHVVFGLGHSAGFRITELRVWACERSADDTQSFLYEYLTAAEKKKKFQVKISNKNKGGGLGKGGLLAPPKGAGLAPPRGLVATTKSGFLPKSGLTGPKGLSLAPPPKEKFSLAPPTKEDKPDTGGAIPAPTPAKDGPPAGFDSAFGGFGQAANESQEAPTFFESAQQPTGEAPRPEVGEQPAEEEEMDVPATLWDTALPLSQQVRSSAAAALIRGPPATRHFGGNRGGLPDFSGMERFGVGGIAICGSEKTIVWRDNEDPPALTYPIGASGAVVSDQMDDMGSEFLCCFLAKERRMVVFELQSRTVVVELQMTTKLNFWRYLPPEAAENTLCFILVTPVGGFHWIPLEESPRPHQIWKRGPDLQGKKVVSYEEGGSNGLDDQDIRSRVGLVMVTKASGAGFLEAWLIPVRGDSVAALVSDDVMGACLCQPPSVEEGPFLPLLVTVHQLEEGVYVNVLSVIEPEAGSMELGEVQVTQMIEMEEHYESADFEAPALAMGTFPEAICCSLSNIVVVILRRKGVIAAFEIEDDDLSLIAQEGVGHYVVDAVMRYSAEVGGAEIVMLLADNENPKDGRIVSFCFRSAA